MKGTVWELTTIGNWEKFISKQKAGKACSFLELTILANLVQFISKQKAGKACSFLAVPVWDVTIR